MSDTSGATAIEYALIATIISIVVVTSVTSMGVSLNGFLASVSTGLR